MNALAAAWQYFPGASRRRALLALALPIIGGMMSQNVLNLVDIGMVGQLGTTALAATGLGSFANWLSMAFILGLSTGVQAICARRLGQQAHGEIAVPLNGGLLLALILGLPLALAIIVFAPPLLSLINPDEEVVREATPYLQVRLAALVAVGMNFSFRGYWSAVHRTKLYLFTLLIMHSINIFLNWVLIFGNLGAPAMGVTGAGLATTLSIWIGTLIYVFFGIRYAWDEGFLHRLPRSRTLFDQMKLSLPASLQQFLFAAGMVALITIVGYIGTRELAAVHVLLTLGLLIVLPAIALGIATATMVGNALGRGDVEDARLWGWNATLFVGAIGLVMSALIVAFGKPILSIFLTDPATLAVAYPPLLITAAVIAFDIAGLVMMHALLGAGATRKVMKISVVCQWAIFLPLATLAGPILGFGLVGVWILQALYRLGQTAWFALAWHRGDWKSIKV
ncbi:MAG: MATE family efflux transporter [Candidatus Wenzhouxiangella sp. M2_3B_020]